MTESVNKTALHNVSPSNAAGLFESATTSQQHCDHAWCLCCGAGEKIYIMASPSMLIQHFFLSKQPFIVLEFAPLSLEKGTMCILQSKSLTS